MQPAKSSPPPNLRHCLREAAARWPARIAIVAGGRQYRYDALQQAVASEVAAWRRAGLAAGDRIAIAAARSPDTLIAILAALEIGGTYIPLDLGYPAERLRAMLEDARARVIVGEPAALDRLAEQVGRFPVLAHPAPADPNPPDADLVYVLFTSGSTGRPKGVAMAREPLDHLIAWHATHARLGLPARTLQFAPLSFDVHFQEILSSIATGGTLVLVSDAERRDPATLRHVLAERQVERLYLPYVALQMLAQADAEAPAEDAALKLRDVVSAGEQLQVTPDIRALFTRQPGAVLHNHYGPTETHVVTAHELSGDPAAWPQVPPIGQALPHVRILLREAPDDVPGTTADAGADPCGELLLGGECLAHGYLGRPDLTAERFVDLPEGRHYVTGDLVRQDARGVLTYLGRADQQLKVDGFRIEPADIELALMAHDDVQTAVVAAPAAPDGGKVLTAYVIPRGGAPADAAAAQRWRAWLRGRVPEYMVPVRFIVVDALPTTPSGKIDRRNLPQPPYAAEAVAQSPGALPVDQAIRHVWCELLGLSHVDGHDNVFDLGAKSLLVLRFVAGMKALGHVVSAAQVYDQPTPDGLAALLRDGVARASRRAVRSPRATDAGGGIAIVGMAVRTAGAKDLQSFWRNLLDGKEGIRHFAPDEIDPATPAELRARPNFVPARGVLEDVDRFDAAFFGLSAREATVLDPQQRLFLELCWTALEQAAIDPAQADGRVGVYAGTSNNSYTPALRRAQPELVQQFGEFGVMLGAEKDYIATRVANRLDLDGPAISIHTACSTSLVAVTQAWHGLASGQCDIALAGGMTVAVPQNTGYLHVEGGMESADGHCRPFDAQASGTVFASGGGVVVLKRLTDALADGDTVYAVIKGVGINNDGGNKASFTAPSVTGQAQAIRMALDHAGVDARSISYVEAHGTGTALGDPIEVAALTQAWSADTADRQFCVLGSVKGHLGHLVAAAGVIGLIKTTLALHAQCLPGTLHYRRPNPGIDFAATPFRVSGEAQPWPRGERVRRAGVSSFGVGGTNAHVIVEEAPPASGTRTATADHGHPVVLPLSARSPDALARRMRDLAAHLRHHADPAPDPQAVLATLTRGRQAMRHRRVVVAPSLAEAAAELERLAATAGPGTGAASVLKQPRVVFVFPGQGAQHPGMARGLYAALPAFRLALDECIAVAQPLLPQVDGTAPDLRGWLLHDDPADARIGALLAQTRFAQPALFAVSYALATWLDSLGVRPAAMIGHSIGEYAAACRANVMSLRDAMTAVVARGEAMYAQTPGAMLAVRCGAQQLLPLLPDGAEIAAHNAPNLTVVAGEATILDALAERLQAQDIGSTRLRVSHAFHSASMDPALPRVEQALRETTLGPPALPVYSCVSGGILTPQDATDPAYWARQVRAPVRFMQAVAAELAHDDTVFVEVGAGQALTALLRQFRTTDGKPPLVVPMAAAPTQQAAAPECVALQAFGQLWSLGVPVAWPVRAGARREVLPTYPFEGERHWFAARVSPTVDPSLPHSTPAGTSIMSRLPRIQDELVRIIGDVSGLAPDALRGDDPLVDLGLDSLSMTQAALELERVFGVKIRFRRMMEDLDSVAKLAAFLDGELPAERFAPPPPPVATAPPPAAAPVVDVAMQAPSSTQPIPGAAMLAGNPALHQLIQQQMHLMSQQLALLSGQVPQAIAPTVAVPPTTQPPSAAAVVAAPAGAGPATQAAAAMPGVRALVEKPFGASARIVLERQQNFTPEQQHWIDDFIARYTRRSGGSRRFSQANRKLMSDPRVVTGFNPLWKDLVYPIVADRSKGARVWDIDGNEYIDLLSCFGANLLGYQPDAIVEAMHAQLDAGIEVGPQHPLAADVARLIAEFTGMERVAFCNTGSEAVMGAMRIARTVTGRRKIAIFSNSYHGIFDEVIVRGTKTLRSLSAAPGILANAVENILVLDWDSEDSLRILREQAHELAAIMTEPVQNKYPTIQPRAFIHALREIADAGGCALIFDEVVTGFRVAPGGAQEFYGVRSDISTYGKIIGGGLPLAAIAGGSRWLDALDGGHWQYGDDSFPEAGVTYFAGTFVRHPLALAAAKATLTHLKQGGKALYDTLARRTQSIADRLNDAFAVRGAPVRAVHCASLWRLSWDDNQKNIALFYYLARFHGLHLYEQFGHFVTEAMGEAECERIVDVFLQCLDELMALGLITPRSGATPPPAAPPAGPGTPAGRRATLDQPPAPTPAALADDAPTALAPGQTERWLAAGFDADARRALNESFCVALQGPVDTGVLRLALQDVIARHEAFRLRFDADQPAQSLDPDARMPIAEVDLTAQADSAQALDAFCWEASGTDFPLDRAPLARASIVRLADGRVVVHVVASHLVFDGWASSVFNEELAQAWQARSRGQAPSWGEAGSARRFAIETSERFEGPEGRLSLAYWQDVLRDPPAPIALGDRRPQGPRSFAGDTVRARLDARGLAHVRAQARAHGATLFQWLLHAVCGLIEQESGQRDMVLSIPFAAQGLARRAALLADGVLDLPVRLRSQPGETQDARMRRIKGALMDAMDHPLMTQGTAARALGIRAEGSRPPLTGIYFNLNPRVDLSGWHPLQATLHEGRKRGLLGELFFNFYEHADALSLDLHHSSEYLGPERAQALVDRLMQRLAPDLAPAGGATPEAAPALDVRLLQWNRTDRPLAPDARIEDWIARQAQNTPDATAVVTAEGALSYAQLESRANRIARMLRSQGAGPGQRVGISLPRGLHLLPAVLGVLKTGAAYVPMDPGFPLERLKLMAEDAALERVVTHSSCAEASGLPPAARLVLDRDADAFDALPDTPLPGGHDSAAAAYVIYTSGSTGRPKGVAVPHRAVCNFLASMQREPGLSATDRLLAVTTLSFDIAVLELLLPLTVGATVVLATRDQAMDGQALAALAARERISVMQATPTTWHLLLDAGWQPPSGFRALVGGEPLPPALASALVAAGVDLWNMYGPTETTVWSTLAHVTDAAAKIHIGRPIDNTQVWIVDEALRPLPVGAEGEICIGGDGVAIGYHGRPDLTAERFVDLAWGPRAGQRAYRTGDLGRWSEDGRLEHLGRLDFQVKIRGYRIELGEIEAQLTQRPGVSQAVVMAREINPGDLALVGYVVAQPGATLDPDALRRDLKATLPDYMLPRVVLVLPALPLLPNNKIDRKALPMPAAIEAASGAPYRAPTSETEQAIAQAMQAALKVERVGLDDDFFSLGGHSLLAARVIGQLNKQWSTQLTLRSLFEAPTVAKLAAAVEAQRRGDAVPDVRRAPIVHQDDQQWAPLTVMQERIRFIEEMQPGRVVYNAPSAHRLSGPMDLQAFERAFQAMVERQPVLRTGLVLRDGRHVQCVHDDVRVSLLPVEDLGKLPREQREAVLAQRLEALAAETFDLGRPPLLKMRLFRLDEDEHALFFMTHHILWDGSSFDILYAEISALYEAFANGRTPDLQPLAITFADYAHWHNAWMDTEELRSQVRFWTRQFAAGDMPGPPLGDVPRAFAGTGKGATEWMHLDEPVVEQARQIARQTGVTVSIVMLSIYAALMSQWLDDRRPAIGMPFRGRPLPELEPIMGFFNNMLPIRLEVKPELGFLDWVRQVRQAMVDAFASQDVPFELLARDLDTQSAGGATRLYQVMFSFQDARQRPTRWGPLAHQRIPLLQKGATEDLNLWMVEIPGGIEAGLQYNAELFLPATIAALRDRFVTMLDAVIRSPQQTVATLLQPDAAALGLLHAWQRPSLPADAPRSVLAMIDEHARRTPRATALRVADQAVTMEDLQAALAQAAAGIRRMLADTPAGTATATVAVLAPNPVGAALCSLAVLEAGATVLPLPAVADAQGIAALRARGDVTAVVSAHALPADAATGWANITLADLLPAAWSWAAADASSVALVAEAADIADAQPLTAAMLDALCAALASQVRPLGSDTCLSVLESGRETLAVLLAAHAWSSAACWQPLSADASTTATGEPQWLANVRATRPGVIRLPSAAWPALAGLSELPAIAPALLLDVDATQPAIIDRLGRAHCTLVSIYVEPSSRLPVAGGLLGRAQDSGLCGRPWMADLLAIVDAQGQVVPPGIVGRPQVRGARGPGSDRLRWRADGVLQYVAAAVRATPAVPAATGSRGTASSATEQAIAEVWTGLLGLPVVGPTDNFFDLGGTSLQAMQAMARLEAVLGRRISAQRLVFDTLAQLAKAYEAANDATPDAPQPRDEPLAAARAGGLIGRLRRLVGRA